VPSANLPPQNSSSWEALVSLYFNNPKLLGSNLIKALNSQDLAQAWFEIRYGSNLGWQGGTNTGTARRRYAESQLFGLANSTYAEALQAYEMLTANRTTILKYEQIYGTDPDTSGNPDTATSALAVVNGYLSNATPSIEAPVAPVQTLTSAFNSEAELIASSLNTNYGSVLSQIEPYDEGALMDYSLIPKRGIHISLDADGGHTKRHPACFAYGHQSSPGRTSHQSNSDFYT
jgi:hypothetical protein